MTDNSSQKNPLVSVLLPVYDPEPEWLRKTVNLVLQQTYDNNELIIVDDGSPTPVSNLLDDDIWHEKSVTHIKQENKGFAAATNRAFREAKGQYVAPISQDDFWEDNKLQSQMVAVKNGHDAVFGHVHVVDKNGGKVGEKKGFPEKDRLERLFYGSYPIYESLLLDTNLVSKDYLLDEEFEVAADWDLWFRIWPDANIKYLDNHIATKRRHSDKLSVQKFEVSIGEGEKIIKKYSEKYGFDDEFRDHVLNKFYQKKGVRLYKRGCQEDARNLWRKGLSLDIYDPKLRILIYLSLFPPLWRIMIGTYSIFNGTPRAKIEN